MKKILDKIAVQATERVWIMIIFILITIIFILLFIVFKKDYFVIEEVKEVTEFRYFATDYITSDYEADEYCMKIQK